MGHAVIATPHVSDAASIVGVGSAAGSMPATNLLTVQPGEVWRATDLANAFVEIQLAAAVAVNLVFLGYTNASAAATWRVRAAASKADLTAAPGYDSGARSHWPTTGLDTWLYTHAFLWLGAAPQNFQFWRIDVSDPGNADGFYQAGRVLIDAAWQLGRNHSLGWQLGYDGGGDQQRAAGNQTYPYDAPVLRVLTLPLRWQTEDDMFGQAMEIDRRCRKAKPVLAIRNPDAPAMLMQQSVYGLVAELTELNAPKFKLYEKTLRIEELLP